MSFSDFGLKPALMHGLEEAGYVHPTPIQLQAIPQVIAGRDLLAAAATGSGKTAAFLLPILDRLLDYPRAKTRALVLTPTRELAAQIDEHFQMLAYHTPLTGAPVFGGVAMGPQERAFLGGVDIMVATPGRLLDHLRYPYGNLDDVEILVLDEADRMLDMGFLPDIRRIIRALPNRRQTLLFSATMPAPIVRLASEWLVDPLRINVDRKAAPAAGVRHTVFPVRPDMKGALLIDVLGRHSIERALVFTRTRQRADRLASYLERYGVPVALIHGELTQSQRTLALSDLKQSRVKVLVATDVAARGIDVVDLPFVINFDVPGQPEDYIHRVGRTARAEATGDAFTFVAPSEVRDLAAIEKAVGRAFEQVVLDGFAPEGNDQGRTEDASHDKTARRRPRRGGPRSSGKGRAKAATKPAERSLVID